MPLHLRRRQPARHGRARPGRPGFGTGTDAADLRMYQAMRTMRRRRTGRGTPPSARRFVDQLDLPATLRRSLSRRRDLPDSEIVARLEIAARMINANLGFRVLDRRLRRLRQPRQPARRCTPTRMQELNAAIARFYAVLNPAWASRVTIMTFSEFGRTSWDNDGQGTDHGSAAPHFVIGPNVKGGLYGQQPSLAGLDRWERMAHHVDFRSYYASIIDGWLGGGSTEVLGGTFENLGLFARAPGKARRRSPIAAGGGGRRRPAASCRSARSGSSTHATAPAACSSGRSVRARRSRVPIAGRGRGPGDGATAVVANVTAVDVSQPELRHRLSRWDGAARHVEPQRRPGTPGAEPGRDGRRQRRLDRGLQLARHGALPRRRVRLLPADGGDRFTRSRRLGCSTPRSGIGVEPPGRWPRPAADRRPGHRPRRCPGVGRPRSS